MTHHDAMTPTDLASYVAGIRAQLASGSPLTVADATDLLELLRTARLDVGMLTVDETMQLAGCSRRTVERAYHPRGPLVVHKALTGEIRIDPTSVMAWLVDRATPTVKT